MRNSRCWAEALRNIGGFASPSPLTLQSCAECVEGVLGRLRPCDTPREPVPHNPPVLPTPAPCFAQPDHATPRRLVFRTSGPGSAPLPRMLGCFPSSAEVPKASRDSAPLSPSTLRCSGEDAKDVEDVLGRPRLCNAQPPNARLCFAYLPAACLCKTQLPTSRLCETQPAWATDSTHGPRTSVPCRATSAPMLGYSRPSGERPRVIGDSAPTPPLALRCFAEDAKGAESGRGGFGNAGFIRPSCMPPATLGPLPTLREVSRASRDSAPLSPLPL